MRELILIVACIALLACAGEAIAQCGPGGCGGFRAGWIAQHPEAVVATPGAGESGPVMVEQSAPLQFQPGQPVRNVVRAVARPFRVLRFLRPRCLRGGCR